MEITLSYFTSCTLKEAEASAKLMMPDAKVLGRVTSENILEQAINEEIRDSVLELIFADEGLEDSLELLEELFYKRVEKMTKQVIKNILAECS